MKELKLSGKRGVGKVVIVDDDIYEEAIKSSWWLSTNGYAHRSKRNNYKHVKCSLHVFIMGQPPRGYLIDHINGDKFDNRRANLRIVNKTVNAINTKKVRTDNKTGYAGVRYHESNRSKCWKAYYKQRLIGSYDSAVTASEAYQDYKEKIKLELLLDISKALNSLEII